LSSEPNITNIGTWLGCRPPGGFTDAGMLSACLGRQASVPPEELPPLELPELPPLDPPLLLPLELPELLPLPPPLELPELLPLPPPLELPEPPPLEDPLELPLFPPSDLPPLDEPLPDELLVPSYEGSKPPPQWTAHRRADIETTVA
jgi:hypothetical protein